MTVPQKYHVHHFVFLNKSLGKKSWNHLGAWLLLSLAVEQTSLFCGIFLKSLPCNWCLGAKETVSVVLPICIWSWRHLLSAFCKQIWHSFKTEIVKLLLFWSSYCMKKSSFFRCEKTSFQILTHKTQTSLFQG